MVANPVTEMQIEAFARLAGIVISPLEFRALCDLDDAVLVVVGKSGDTPDRTVEASDGAGVRGLMQGLGAKRRGIKGGND